MEPGSALASKAGLGPHDSSGTDPAGGGHIARLWREMDKDVRNLMEH